MFNRAERILNVPRRAVRFGAWAERAPTSNELSELPEWIGNRSADRVVEDCVGAFLQSVGFSWRGAQAALGNAVRQHSQAEATPLRWAALATLSSPLPWLDDEAIWERALYLGRLETGGDFSVDMDRAATATFRRKQQLKEGQVRAAVIMAAVQGTVESCVQGVNALINLMNTTRFRDLPKPTRYDICNKVLSEATDSLAAGKQPAHKKSKSLKAPAELDHTSVTTSKQGVRVTIKHSQPVHVADSSDRPSSTGAWCMCMHAPHTCKTTSIDACMHAGIDTCVDMHADTCTDMRTSMCIGMYAYRRVRRHAHSWAWACSG